MAIDDAKFIASGVDFILGAADIEKALDGLVKAAANAVGSDCASLFLLERRSGLLYPKVLHNFPPEYAATCGAIPLGQQCCGRAALHKMPWISEDMATDPIFADDREAIRQSGLKSVFSVPVLDARGDCLGALAVHFREPYIPSIYALERNKLFAQLIAFAIARQVEHGPQKAKAAAASADDAVAD